VTDERWQLAYAIYEAAAPLGEPQRSQYVRIAAPDAEIAAKVLAMLDEMEATADTGASPEHTDSKNPAAPLVPPMVLYPGAEIGSYQILKPLGSGGMSDVYLAYDRRLDRRVAIKLLPAHLAADAVARDRLRREALAAAALDHPFICKIFEIGEDKGTLFIVMEYISGETLYARMRAGPLRRTEALRIAVEVAEALEEAHAKRLVHRDLKPANVMLTSQGRAKVMDFGLAKGPVSDEIKDVDARAAGPTLTAAGTVVGTPEYMSPEQMTGAPLDHRSDLFSFGVILCELLTGKHPFQRNSKLETMTAILRDSPDLPVTGKAGLSQGEMVLIRRLLAKLPDERYQSMREVRDDLAKLEPGPHEGPLRIVHAQGLPLRRRWSLVLTGLLVMVAASGLVWFAGHRAPSARPEPKPHRLTANPAGNPATSAHISPDGKYLAYADRVGIHLQLIDSGETWDFPQPQGLGYEVTGWWPVGWFPDGTRLLAQASSLGAEHSGLWVIPVLGGAPREIRESAVGWSVSPDGSLIAFTSTSLSSDIWLMGPNGEEPRKIVSAPEGESLNWVVWSPDSHRIAYERLHSGAAGGQCDIEDRDLTGGEPTFVLSDPKLAAWMGGGLWWSADGRLIYPLVEATFGAVLRDTNLWEIKIDTGSGKTTGKPERITNWAGFSLTDPNATIDARRLVFSRVSRQTHVYIGEVGGGGTRLKAPPRRLTLDEHNDWPTAWTPDSKALLFGSDRSGKRNVYKQALDQDSGEPLLANAPVDLVFPRLSADGAWILYVRAAKLGDTGTSGPVQLRRVPVSGGPSQFVLTAHDLYSYRCARAPATVCLASEWSEDQKQLIFTAFDPIEGRGGIVSRIATKPGFDYNWDLSPDGSQIAMLFPAGENRIRLLPVSGGEPRDLVVKGWYGFKPGPDWAADGKGFYVSSSSPRGVTLLYIDLAGHASAVWEQKGGFETWGVPSPDGRHLAILGDTVDSNVWMLENF
jgi:eukaryotic-like serine/threonine-protein kinase